VQGQICDILRRYESLPAPLATQIPTLWIRTSGGRGRGGALILDRCRAFDLFASVDAHLCYLPSQAKMVVYAPAEGADTLLLFLLCMYSVPLPDDVNPD
jgi:hypothetical protein